MVLAVITDFTYKYALCIPSIIHDFSFLQEKLKYSKLFRFMISEAMLIKVASVLFIFNAGSQAASLFTSLELQKEDGDLPMCLSLFALEYYLISDSAFSLLPLLALGLSLLALGLTIYFLKRKVFLLS